MPDQTQAMMSQRSRLRARYDNFIGGKWQAPGRRADTSSIQVRSMA